MKTFIWTMALLALMGFGAFSVHAAQQAKAPTQEQMVPVYRCPMHPDVQATWPARCPKCGMSLAKAGEMPAGAMMGATGQTAAPAQKAAAADLKNGAPAALLSVRKELKLTDQQVTELKAIAEEAEKKATALLTDEQKEALKSLPEGQKP